MPFNGSGTFTLNQDFPADSAAGPPDSTISSSKVDNELKNIKSGLELALLRDGQNAASGNVNFGSNRLLNVGAATASTDGLSRTTGDGRYRHNSYSFGTSVASNALTITLNNAAGSTPASTDAAYVRFRGVSASTGTQTTLAITSSTTLVISSGSTMGASNGTAFRLWIVGFNDGGTFRLGAINCRSSANGIYPLGGYPIASSSAEGGAGGADSAQTFYTGTAVTAKAYEILGYIDYEDGLTTAGTWDTAPSHVHVFEAGRTPLPGQIIQTNSEDNSTAFNTTSTSYQDTGVNVGITPTAKANIIRGFANGDAFQNGSGGAVLRIDRSGTDVGVQTSHFTATGATNSTGSVTLRWIDFPESTSSLDYEVQLKSSNGNASHFPVAVVTVTHALIQVEEIMA